jgi:hypothetical protein
MKNLTIKDNKNEEFTYKLPIDSDYVGKILIDPVFNIICVYNGTVLKLFEFAKGNEELYEFELPEFDNKILDIKSLIGGSKMRMNDKVYFCFCFKNKRGKFFSFYITLDLNNEILFSDLYETEYDEALTKEFSFININSDIYICEKIIPNKIKIFSLENKNKEYEININNFNNILFINKFNEYDINKIPFFCKNNGDGSSSILLIDFLNKTINERKINGLYFSANSIEEIDTKNKFLMNIRIKKEDKKFIYKIIYKKGPEINSESDEPITESFSLKINENEESVHNLDTELIINSGMDSGNTYVSIRSNSPAYNDKNDNLFLSRHMSDTTISGVTEDGNEKVTVESVDDNEVDNNTMYKNEMEINRLLRAPDKENINDLDFFDPVRKKESVLVQEFSSDLKGTVFFLSKDVNKGERNKLVIRTKENNNNIPIVIEGGKINDVESEEESNHNFNIIHTNSCALPPSNNTKYIFPFINKANSIFSSFTLDKGEIFTAQNIFLNYISVYKYNKDADHNLFTNILENENNVITKLLVCSYIKSCLGQDELVSIIDNSQHMKIICERFGLIDKNDIVDTSLELLSNSENKDSIFEYINEYGGYKLKD